VKRFSPNPSTSFSAVFFPTPLYLLVRYRTCASVSVGSPRVYGSKGATGGVGDDDVTTGPGDGARVGDDDVTTGPGDGARVGGDDVTTGPGDGARVGGDDVTTGPGDGARVGDDDVTTGPGDGARVGGGDASSRERRGPSLSPKRRPSETRADSLCCGPGSVVGSEATLGGSLRSAGGGELSGSPVVRSDTS
jgi:hypothetical protein